MVIETTNIRELKSHPQNPRNHPELDRLVNSIKEYGWTNPVLVSEDGFILAGHARVKAAELLGMEEVPVIRLPLSGDKATAYLIADNRLAELSEWDLPKLKDLIDGLNAVQFDLEMTGFRVDEIEALMAEIYIEPEIKDDGFDVTKALEQIELPVTQPGDICALGCHRMMCGDSTVSGHVEKLMQGNEAELIFTDPPYNVDYTGGTKDALKIQNDHMGSEQFYEFLFKAFSNMKRGSAPGAAIYICHADSEGLNFRRAMHDSGWLQKQCIIWVKNGFVLGRQDYHWRHEMILYGWKPGAAHRWYGGRRQDTVIDDVNIITVQETDSGTTITLNSGIHTVVLKVPSFEVLHTGTDEDTSVWRFEKPLRNGEHPTMKPVGIPARAIMNSSRPGDIVLDLFGGSGSTLIAAEQTNRKCYTMELDPIYCDVIIKRWEQFTGQQAKRITE